MVTTRISQKVLNMLYYIVPWENKLILHERKTWYTYYSYYIFVLLYNYVYYIFTILIDSLGLNLLNYPVLFTERNISTVRSTTDLYKVKFISPCLALLKFGYIQSEHFRPRDVIKF